MYKYIGLIVATKEELEEVEKIMVDIKKKNIYNLEFLEGEINNNNYVVVQCGVGKVNAARTTQVLIDNYNVKYVINAGVAGGISNKVQIGDIVIGKELVQHDFDITAFGHTKGYISDTGRSFISNDELVKKCKSVTIENINIIVGNIASGDIFCTDIKMKEKIREKFNCDCVEMEGAAIAQVCFLSNIPFVVIRAISDVLNGENQKDYEEFVHFAAKNCAKFIEQLGKL